MNTAVSRFNLVYGCKLGTGIRPNNPTKEMTAHLSLFSVAKAIKEGKQRMVGMTLSNPYFFLEAMFIPLCW